MDLTMDQRYSRLNAKPRKPGYGTLMLIGGHADRDGECVILNEVARRVRQSAGRLVIVTNSPGADIDKCVAFFKRAGVRQIDCVTIATREDASQTAHVTLIRSASAIFFGGSNAHCLAQVIEGSALHAELPAFYAKGGLLVGDDGGAAALSEMMILDGMPDHPVRASKTPASGLRLLEDVATDPRFSSHDGIWRLISTVAKAPFLLGLGLDEDTAFIIDPEAQCTVLGAGAVYIIDGSAITYANVQNNDVMTGFNIKLHVLTNGYGFHLPSRTPTLI